MSSQSTRPISAQRKRLGRYEVLAHIASGAMGVVYLGRLQGVGGFERLFAIKVLHEHLAERPQLVNMLLAEARLAAQIQHPNAVSVVDVEISSAGEHYVVMDYIDGFTLCELLDHPRLDAVRRVRLGLRILLDTMAGLDAAHRLCNPSDGTPLQIVHRDVSPNNILVSQQGAGLITDFGIARVSAYNADSLPGVIKGTPCYMAPEQVTGSDQLDARADVWSLGAVLWEVLTGEQLFYSPAGVGGVLSLVVTGDIPSPSERNSRIPAALDAVCLMALERDPDLRCASVRDLAEALERVARGHDLVASTRETADTLAQLFEEQLESRRSWLPGPDPDASSSTTAPADLMDAADSARAVITRLPAAEPAAPDPVSDDELDRQLARLPLRRPPWLLIALSACAAAAALGVYLVDVRTPAPRMHAEPPTSPAASLRIAIPELDTAAPLPEPRPELDATEPPPVRHIAFAAVSRPKAPTSRAARATGPSPRDRRVQTSPPKGTTRARGAAAEGSASEGASAESAVLEANPYLLAR